MAAFDHRPREDQQHHIGAPAGLQASSLNQHYQYSLRGPLMPIEPQRPQYRNNPPPSSKPSPVAHQLSTHSASFPIERGSSRRGPSKRPSRHSPNLHEKDNTGVLNTQNTQSSAKVALKDFGKVERHDNERKRNSADCTKSDEYRSISAPIQKVPPVEVDGTSIYDTARTEIVDRLMDTFYELFGEIMQDSCSSESEDSSSGRRSSSASTSNERAGARQDSSVEWEESLFLGPKPRDYPSSPDSTYGSWRRRVPSDQRDGNRKDSMPESDFRKRTRAQSSSTGNQTVGGKRRRDSSDGEHSGSEDQEDRRKQPRQSSAKNPDLLNSLRRFSCPFMKRYPQRPPKCAACVYPGFSTTHRVKEHLYRNHIRPCTIRCPRCYESFDDEALLRAHVTATQRCPEGKEPPKDEGLSQEQERSLRSKRRLGRESSEEARWRQIFQICFPEVLEVDIPSPCKWIFSEFTKQC